jgi:hypothetical protein
MKQMVEELVRANEKPKDYYDILGVARWDDEGQSRVP